MTAEIVPAGPADASGVLELMREFHANEELPYDRDVVMRALKTLFEDPSLARVYLTVEDGQVLGYVVLAFGFSFEFDGRDAMIDELYVREDARGRGLGTAMLTWVEGVCRAEDVRALHLEVDDANERGHRLYRRLGYQDHDRHLLTKWLQPR